MYYNQGLSNQCAYIDGGFEGGPTHLSWHQICTLAISFDTPVTGMADGDDDGDDVDNDSDDGDDAGCTQSEGWLW